MRLFTLVFLGLLTVSFTACFPELTEDAVISSVEDPVVDPPMSTTGNFQTDIGAFEINHAYIVSQPIGAGEMEQHHLILTRDDVAENGQLVGTTTAFTVTITGPAGDIAGVYDTGSALDPERSALTVEIFQRLSFSVSNNSRLRAYDAGWLEIKEIEGDHEITLDFEQWNTSLRGTLTTKLIPITLEALRQPPSAGEFQGPNQFVRGGAAIALNHAYYVRVGRDQFGIDEYRLYLTESEITATDELSGVSTAMVFVAKGNLISRPESFVSGEGFYDYFAFLRPRIEQSLFCTNYNFRTRDFDTDEPTDGETRLIWEGEELMVSFQGIISGTTTVAEGLYRGPVTVID